MRLVLGPGHKHRGSGSRREPPPVRNLAAAGVLGGAMGRANFVAVTPEQHSALVVISGDMLRFSYHIRYELLEFAVYVLAARAQQLVPLHAACVGRGGRGVLLMGRSGAGKSTLVLHSLLGGLDFLAEDSVLVAPQSLRATGIANFVHLRRDALRFLDRRQRLALMRESTPVRRRSGVAKLEIDLRRTRRRLAAAPLRICAVVFISVAKARGHSLLTPLPKSVVLRRLAANQRYAAEQPGWRTFRARLARLPGYELRRGVHPREAAAAVRLLLWDGYGRA